MTAVARSLKDHNGLTIASVVEFPLTREKADSPLVECEVWVDTRDKLYKEKRALTQKELEEYTQSIVKDGYVAFISGERTVIYPPHAIEKVEIIYRGGSQ
jgi:hypothetical protein